MTAPEPEVDPLDVEDDEQPESHETWDAFWAEVQREEAAARGGLPTQVIRGVTVTVPHDLPLKFDRAIDQVRDSSTEDDTRRVLAELFGADVLGAWIDAGMTAAEFQVVLLWGVANGKGKELTFREAYDQFKARVGKASSSTTTSGGSGDSGGRSKRTSMRGTGSPRRTSRT